MKRAIAFGLGVVISMAANAELYRVHVHRVDQDLYRTNDGIFIKTNYCYQYSYGEEAILDWNGSWGKLIFPDSGNTCDVSKLLR